MAPRLAAWVLAVAVAGTICCAHMAAGGHVAADTSFQHLHPGALAALYQLDESVTDAAAGVSAAAGVPSASAHPADAATVDGAVVFQAGVAGHGLAAYFDSNSRVSTPHDVNPSAMPAATFGAWVKPVSLNWASSAPAYDRERCVRVCCGGANCGRVAVRAGADALTLLLLW